MSESVMVERHGAAVRSCDGRTLDRGAVARATFGHPEHLSHLEGLVHPRVRARLADGLAAAVRRRDAPAVVLDVPLLLESSPDYSATLKGGRPARGVGSRPGEPSWGIGGARRLECSAYPEASARLAARAPDSKV